jgi:hypothetical protein
MHEASCKPTTIPPMRSLYPISLSHVHTSYASVSHLRRVSPENPIGARWLPGPPYRDKVNGRRLRRVMSASEESPSHTSRLGRQENKGLPQRMEVQVETLGESGQLHVHWHQSQAVIANAKP